MKPTHSRLSLTKELTLKALTEDALNALIATCSTVLGGREPPALVRTLVLRVLTDIEHPTIPSKQFAKSVLDWHSTGYSSGLESWLEYNPGTELQVSLALPEIWASWLALKAARDNLAAVVAATKVGNAKP